MDVARPYDQERGRGCSMAFVAVVRLSNVVPFLQYRRLRFIFGAQRANTNLGTEVNNWCATESNKKKRKKDTPGPGIEPISSGALYALS